MTGKFNAVGPSGFGTYDVSWQNGHLQLERCSETCADTLVPGFVDLHIHGAFGVDVMSASTDDLITLCDRLAKLGYESFLPTTVTASVLDVQRAIGSLPSHPMIEGFHLEGPFISSTFPGAQPPEWIADPSDLAEWRSVLEDPQLTIITLAPEVPGALGLVKSLTDQGVIVSLGHTNATSDQAVAAFLEGASNVTHSFNAMAGLHHRHPGLLGAAMTDDNVICELIYDHHHVSKIAAEILLRCKGAGGVVAVSDSSAATGLADGSKLTMWGHDCEVNKGTVRLAGTDTLAGSTATLLDCFRNLYDDFGPEIAIALCSINSRRVLGKEADQATTWLRFNDKLELVDIFRPSSQ